MRLRKTLLWLAVTATLWLSGCLSDGPGTAGTEPASLRIITAYDPDAAKEGGVSGDAEANHSEGQPASRGIIGIHVTPRHTPHPGTTSPPCATIGCNETTPTGVVEAPSEGSWSYPLPRNGSLIVRFQGPVLLESLSLSGHFEHQDPSCGEAWYATNGPAFDPPVTGRDPLPIQGDVTVRIPYVIVCSARLSEG